MIDNLRLTTKPSSDIVILLLLLEGFFMRDIKLYESVYCKYMNLKLAASELGIPWQTLYYHLRLNDIPVLGDKDRYGSATDKLASYTEALFQKTVPSAMNHNMDKFQASLDFSVCGVKVDVKSSTKKDGYKNNPNKNPAFRWAFSSKVQEKFADFMVCYCFSGESCEDHGNVEMILLIPKEFFKNKQSISVSCNNSKWYEFTVSESELKEFFENL